MEKMFINGMKNMHLLLYLDFCNFLDYKRLKGDLKRASADTAKLKKKASKKIGKQEYTDQFREALKVRL